MRIVPLFFLSLAMIAVTPAYAEHHEAEAVLEDLFAAAAKNLTAEEKRNLEAVKGWAEAWENDVGRMADEFYADSPVIYAPIQNLIWVGPGGSKEAWRTAEVEERRLEESVHPDASTKMEFSHIVVKGDTVALRGVGIAIFLRFNKDGKIYSDHSFYSGVNLNDMLQDPKLLTSGTRVPGGRTPAYQAALEKIAEQNQ